jgi:probable rRNA maturation factor
MPTDVLRRARGAPPLATARVRKAADRMLTELGLEGAELSVLLTDDATIQRLNLAHRGKDSPTDVLAFPLDERAAKRAHAHATGGSDLVLGDVVISLHTALRQARSRKRELWPEVRFLLAHGLLHLIGYDHANPRDKREMSALTRRLVRNVSDAPAPKRARKARGSGR